MAELSYLIALKSPIPDHIVTNHCSLQQSLYPAVYTGSLAKVRVIYSRIEFYAISRAGKIDQLVPPV